MSDSMGQKSAMGDLRREWKDEANAETDTRGKSTAVSGV
jgi:hypothetical protein